MVSHSPAETEALGEVWGRLAGAGDVFALTGGLGVGKTALARGLARGLGIAGRVHSPTFAIVNEYRGGRLPLYHLDLYRLETPDQVAGAGLESYLEPDGVTVIEWADRLGGNWPEASAPGGSTAVVAGSAQGFDLCVAPPNQLSVGAPASSPALSVRRSKAAQDGGAPVREEGARRAGEGASAGSMAATRSLRTVETSHELARAGSPGFSRPPASWPAKAGTTNQAARLEAGEQVRQEPGASHEPARQCPRPQQGALVPNRAPGGNPRPAHRPPGAWRWVHLVVLGEQERRIEYDDAGA